MDWAPVCSKLRSSHLYLSCLIDPPKQVLLFPFNRLENRGSNTLSCLRNRVREKQGDIYLPACSTLPSQLSAWNPRFRKSLPSWIAPSSGHSWDLARSLPQPSFFSGPRCMSVPILPFCPRLWQSAVPRFKSCFLFLLSTQTLRFHPTSLVG